MHSSRITQAALRAIRDELLQGGVVFRMTWDELLRHFLHHFLGDDAHKMSAAELRAAYLTLPGADKGGSWTMRVQGGEAQTRTRTVPEEPQEFARFVIETYLNIVELPRDVLARLYAQASDDLHQIKLNIEECHRRIQLACAASGDQSMTPDNHSWAQVYRYYLDQNTAARDEIVDFLADRIKEKAVSIARNRWRFSFISYTYPYSIDPSSYHPDDYSDVTNKFLSEDVHQARAWAALYHRDPPAFFGQLDKFLVERNVLPNLRAALDSHHRFHARSAVLKTALEAYHSESWDVFATLAIIQIEGLFLDYCEDLGVDEAELARSSLPRKIQAIVRHRGHFADFPYYAYRLPVVRNHLAHGRALDTGGSRDAKMILLDLAAVFELVQDPDLLVNQCVELMRSTAGAAASLQRNKCVLLVQALFELGIQAPPKFYGLQQEWDTHLARLDASETISFTRDLVSQTGAELTSRAELAILRGLIIQLLRRSSAKEQWRRLLSSPPLSQLDSTEHKFGPRSWEPLRVWIQAYNPSPITTDVAEGS